MNEVKLLEILCKVRAIEATILGGPYKKEYLAYLNYFDTQVFNEIQAEMEKNVNGADQ